MVPREKDEMSCCGKKRVELLQQRRTMFVTPDPAPAAPSAARTAVVFTGKGAYLASGSHSREVYQFSSADPVGMVDARDAAALIRSGLFQARK
jgi:hypothetical protein